MNRIETLAAALQAGRKEFEQLMAEDCKVDFRAEEIYDIPADAAGDHPKAGNTAADLPQSGRIAAGDNLAYMHWLLRRQSMAGRIQMIYVDPPFFSNAAYQASVQITSADGRKSPVLKVGAYNDQWGHDFGAYLEMLTVRFLLMRELLDETGCLWVHLDWHGSHYVKMLLDEIFGEKHFINEVAWTYKSGGASKNSFARKHDTLLFYSKTKHYKFHPLKEKSYNRGGKPYRFKGVEEFQDEQGWYTVVNMKDVWSIDMVGRTSKERTGYATQKPEKLLERIVDACSDAGDLCADFFAGTGTLGAVCSRRSRPWIMCDDGSVAIKDQIRRLSRYPGRLQIERPATAYDLQPAPAVQVEMAENQLRLLHYQPDLSLVQERDREVVSAYAQQDYLDLIRIWSVDTAYDGSVHRASQLYTGSEPVMLTADAAENNRVHIAGYDCLGGRFTWEGELR